MNGTQWLLLGIALLTAFMMGVAVHAAHKRAIITYGTGTAIACILLNYFS